MKKTNINFAIKSIKGKRSINQDSLVCTYNENGDFIAIVCDGIGSVKYSEVASKLICKVFAVEFEKTKKIEKPVIWAKQTLEIAMKKLEHISDENHTPGIATTMAMIIIADNKFYAFNIGDTRIYGITKDKKIDVLTKDHNYYNFLIKKGVHNRTLNINKAKWFALTRYIDASKPDKAKFDYIYNDTSKYRYFVICTDGLYGYIKENKMVKVAKRCLFPLACRAIRLNSIAYNNHSNDNISNILISCRTYGK